MSKPSVVVATIVAVAAIVLAIVVLVEPRGAVTSAKLELALITGETKENADLFGYALSGGTITVPGPTLRVRKGQQVTITVTNVHGTYSGERLQHNLVVAATKDAVEPLWGAGTDAIDVGKSDSITFTPMEVGQYFYLCSIPGHLWHGMHGTFIVDE